jgi:hypothetical protein
MASAFTAGGVLLDSPEAKVFQIDVPENDPVNTPTAMTFAGAGPLGGGMGLLNAVPQEYYAIEVTPNAAVPTVACRIAINGMSTTGFTVLKTSVQSAQAVNHTYQVYVHTRRFYQ